MSSGRLFDGTSCCKMWVMPCAKSTCLGAVDVNDCNGGSVDFCSSGGGVSTLMRNSIHDVDGKGGAISGQIGGGPAGSGAIHRGGGGLASRRVYN